MHGLAKARERGIVGGSKMKWSAEQVVAAVKAHGSYANAAKRLRCSEITIKRKMAEAKEKGLI